MATKLFIGGLSYETTEKELEDAFSKYGEVVSVDVIMDRGSGKSKGFGFVEMTHAEEALKAITSLHGKDLGGRKLTVNQARPPKGR